MAEFLSVSVPRNIQQRRLYTGSNCKVLYRFDEEKMEWITNHFLGQYEETRGGALVHTNPLFQGFSEVSANIMNRSTEWIKFPKVAEEMRFAQRKWQAKYKFR